jgi:hypothetical protein
MFHAWENFPLGSPITLQLIRDDDPWSILAALEQLAEEFLRRLLVPPALHQDIEHAPILIDRPPEIVPLTTNGEKHFIEMPLVTRLRPTTTQLIGILLAEFPAPLPDRFIRYDDAAGQQEFLHIAVAQAETEVQPDAMADDFRWKSVILVSGGLRYS